MAGEQIRHGTLAMNVVARVDLANHRRVEVLNRSTAVIWFTLDSDTDPVVGGDDVWALPAGAARVLDSRSGQPTQVRLLAAEAADFSIAGLG